MKFVSKEWFEAHKEVLKEVFSEPANLSAELVEVYQNWDEGKTAWVYYKVVDGLVVEVERGEGEEELPAAMFRCFGEYETYCKVLRGELDPKMGIMTKQFKLEGNMMKAMGMLGVYDKITEAKKVPGLEL